MKRQEAWILYINNIINYLGIPSDLPELLLTGNVFWVIFEFGVAIGVKIGLSAGSPPPMASVEYLIFVYSRVLFWKKKEEERNEMRMHYVCKEDFMNFWESHFGIRI